MSPPSAQRSSSSCSARSTFSRTTAMAYSGHCVAPMTRALAVASSSDATDAPFVASTSS
eukprot:CAMPEP_0195118298 /NCGR_PEP_ID=MMETSP0448-20130528/116635_1 /TAXON_ID=66468 /ORGANISM="Heterocapsa triquestra, Strain CCMP 448" /LENGTH=58 /DNA_ID=CAMNT_0040155553 /DNA_START=8 /DNA_END=181 /DNA_ORIENTATION=+